MLRRFTEHPGTVNETYLQHLATAFGFGTRMLVGGVGCFVHGLFPWLCLTRGSDTVRLLHHRMVTHRVVQAPRPHPRREATAALPLAD
jgi:hypothetical protein